MALTYVDGHTINGNSASSGSFTLPHGVGVAIGDLAVCVYYCRVYATTNSFTAPTITAPNFSIVNYDTSGYGRLWVAGFWVTQTMLTNGYVASWSAGGASSATNGEIVAVFRGVDPTTPLDGVSPTAYSATSVSVWNPAAVTPTTTGAAVVVVGGAIDDMGTTWAVSTNFTSDWPSADNSTDSMYSSWSQTGGTDGCCLVEWRLGRTGGVQEDPANTLGSTQAATTVVSYTFALKPTTWGNATCKQQLPIITGTATNAPPSRTGSGGLKVQLPVVGGAATASQPIGTGAFKLQRPIIVGTATNAAAGMTGAGAVKLQRPIIGGTAKQLPKYSSSLPSLSAGTTYHVRAWATNNDGSTGYGSEVDFTTDNRGTGSVKVQLPLLRGTATASQPIGTGGFKLQAPLLSGSATNVPPPRSANGGIKLQLPLVRGTATASQPLGSGSFRVQPALVGGTGTVVNPPRSAAGNLRVQSPLVGGAATNTVGNNRSAAGGIKPQLPLLGGTATASQPIGTGAVKLQRPVFTATAIASQPIGTGSTRLQRPLIGGSATNVPPARTAAGTLKLQSPLVRGSVATSGDTVFVSEMTGPSGTWWYLRAYATNADGATGYGDEYRFMTEHAYGLATGSSVLKVPGNEECPGSAWLQGPATGEADGSAELVPSGGYVSLIPDLLPGTHYYVRSYAENSETVGYGSAVEFDTAAETEGTATGSAHLSGGPTRDISGSAVLQESGFHSDLIDLVPGTHYYVRSYATNATLTGYGQTLQFDTVFGTEGEAFGSASLLEIPLGVATGSAVLQQNAKTFQGLMAGLFHARMLGTKTGNATGGAILLLETAGNADGSAELTPVGDLFHSSTGSAYLTTSFHGLMGQLFHAKLTKTLAVSVSGSAWLGLLPVAYAYGSAVLRRVRSGDASGSADLQWFNPRFGPSDGSAVLKGAATGGCEGSAVLVESFTGEADGSASLILVPVGGAYGSAQLQPFSDGSCQGSAFLGYGHAKSAYGSAVLRSVYKGKTEHPRREPGAAQMKTGGKIAHMKRSKRKGVMDKWP